MTDVSHNTPSRPHCCRLGPDSPVREGGFHGAHRVHGGLHGELPGRIVLPAFLMAKQQEPSQLLTPRGKQCCANRTNDSEHTSEEPAQPSAGARHSIRSHELNRQTPGEQSLSMNHHSHYYPIKLSLQLPYSITRTFLRKLQTFCTAQEAQENLPEQHRDEEQMKQKDMG